MRRQCPQANIPCLDVLSQNRSKDPRAVRPALATLLVVNPPPKKKNSTVSTLSPPSSASYLLGFAYPTIVAAGLRSRPRRNSNSTREAHVQACAPAQTRVKPSRPCLNSRPRPNDPPSLCPKFLSVLMFSPPVSSCLRLAVLSVCLSSPVSVYLLSLSVCLSLSPYLRSLVNGPGVSLSPPAPRAGVAAAREPLASRVGRRAVSDRLHLGLRSVRRVRSATNRCGFNSQW